MTDQDDRREESLAHEDTRYERETEAEAFARRRAAERVAADPLEPEEEPEGTG
jgi:hypothetical protein